MLPNKSINENNNPEKEKERLKREEELKSKLPKVEVDLTKWQGIWSSIISVIAGPQEDIDNKLLFRRMIALTLDLIILIYIFIEFGTQHMFWITFLYFFIMDGIIGFGTIGKLVTMLKLEMEDMYNDGIINFRLTRTLGRAAMKGLIFGYLIISFANPFEVKNEEAMIHLPWLAILLVIMIYLPARISDVGRTFYDALTGTYISSRTEKTKLVPKSQNRLFYFFENKSEQIKNTEKIHVILSTQEVASNEESKPTIVKETSSHETSEETEIPTKIKSKKDLDKLF